MPTDGLIGIAADENELAVGSGNRRSRITHPRWRILPRQFRKDYGQNSHLPESYRNLSGRIRQQFGMAVPNFGQGAGQCSGKMPGVGVGKEDPLPGSLSHAGG